MKFNFELDHKDLSFLFVIECLQIEEVILNFQVKTNKDNILSINICLSFRQKRLN